MQSATTLSQYPTSDVCSSVSCRWDGPALNLGSSHLLKVFLTEIDEQLRVGRLRFLADTESIQSGRHLCRHSMKSSLEWFSYPYEGLHSSL